MVCRGLIFSKKYFWFHDQPVEQKHLASYISGEKSKDLAHANAAHASVTGKGLLFFAKRAEDKHHPQGIMNLVSSDKTVPFLAQKLTQVFLPGRYV